MATVKADAPLPRKLKGSVGAISTALDGGLDNFFALRQAGEDSSRQCLSSIFALASSLHTPHLPYYSKTLETSRARHVTVEQIWGQMNMLLRPVLRRLQDNVRRLQKITKDSSSEQKSVTTRGGTKRLRDEDESVEAGRDVLSTRTSELGESDLDEEIAQLLTEQQKRRKLKKTISKNDVDGDDSWRYAFGKGRDEDSDADDADFDGERDEEYNDDDDDDNNNNNDARISRRHAWVKADANDADDGGDEELAALKEMYGEDFDLDEDEEGDGDGGDGDDDDPHFEDDLAWDDPSAVFNENEGKYFGEDNILADDGSGMPGRSAQPAGDAGDDEEDDAELNDPSLTALERERLRERRLVARLEQERLYSTQWAMGGEVSGNNRPRDALLDEELDFEHAMKAVPVITEAVTARLEDRIRRRILDGNYDDVQRRTALSTPADLTTTRRDAAADAEKSKLSLMDLYEKDYLERLRAAEDKSEGNNAEPLTEVERDELRAIEMWRRLAQHLDGLSNFYYTPRPVREDLAARVRAVDGQAPAITLEAVGNFATTREAALAPQDLYRGADRKYADVGGNELLPRERRALRRAKKEQTKAANDRKEKRAVQAKKMKQQQKQQ